MGGVVVGVWVEWWSGFGWSGGDWVEWHLGMRWVLARGNATEGACLGVAAYGVA